MRGAAGRSRPVQDDQRQPRPRRRRPSAAAGVAQLRDSDLRRDDRRAGSAATSSPSSCRSVESRDELEQLCLALVSALQGPFLYRDQRLFVGASVGVAIGPRDGDTVEELIRNADLALYRAKDGSGNDIRFYEPALHARAEERRKIELALHGAMDAGEFSLAYQPVVDAQSVRDPELRSAAALAQSRARPDSADQVHPDRRGDRHARADRRMGAAHRLPRGGRPGPATSRSRSTSRRASCATRASSSPWFRR